MAIQTTHIRGEGLDLPSGEAIARAMGVTPLSLEEKGIKKAYDTTT